MGPEKQGFRASWRATVNSCGDMVRPKFEFGIALSHALEWVEDTELRRALSLKLASSLIFHNSAELRTTWNWCCFDLMISISLSFAISAIKFPWVDSSPGTTNCWWPVLEVKSALASMVEADEITVCPSKRQDRSHVVLQLPMKAAADVLEAFRKPSPPNRTGKIACFQHWSGKDELYCLKTMS